MICDTVLCSFCFLYRVQARLQQSLKTDPVRPEFYRAIIRWEANDGSGSAG